MRRGLQRWRHNSQWCILGAMREGPDSRALRYVMLCAYRRQKFSEEKIARELKIRVAGGFIPSVATRRVSRVSNMRCDPRRARALRSTCYQTQAEGQAGRGSKGAATRPRGQRLTSKSHASAKQDRRSSAAAYRGQRRNIPAIPRFTGYIQ